MDALATCRSCRRESVRIIGERRGKRSREEGIRSLANRKMPPASFFAIAICAALFALFCATPAWAQNATNGQRYSGAVEPIVVQKGVTAITLDGVTIASDGGAAITVENGASVTITLQGVNSLQGGASNGTNYPAIHVKGSAKVVFSGPGSLDARGHRESGYYYAVGIGSSENIDAPSGTPLDAFKGTVVFGQSGTVTLNKDGEDSPAVGDSRSTSTGIVQFSSGRTVIDGYVSAKTVLTSGGIVDAKYVPYNEVTYSVYDPGDSSQSDASKKKSLSSRYVRITGLPADLPLTAAKVSGFTVSSTPFSFTTSASSFSTAGYSYNVSGCERTADSAWGIFLPVKAVNNAASDVVADRVVTFTFPSGTSYAGSLKEKSDSEGTVYYELALTERLAPVDSPVITVNVGNYNQTVQFGTTTSGEKMYRVYCPNYFSQPEYDSGWITYTGVPTIKETGNNIWRSYDLAFNGSNHSVRFDNVHFVREFTLEKDAELTIDLVGNNEIYMEPVPKGIVLSEGSKLVITSDSGGSLNARRITGGTGTLVVKSGTLTCQDVVAIGGAIHVGACSIEGGTVYAKGKGGPGIIPAKSFVIKRGTVVAQGDGAFNPGIGTGYGSYCGTIDIKGGKVTATAGEFAPAIGAYQANVCGKITISGGTVDATGGMNMPNTGRVSAIQSTSGVVINGGTVKCNGVKQSVALSALGLAGDVVGSRVAYAGEPAPSSFVNEAGEAVCLVTLTGLPANSSVQDLELRLVDTDFVETPEGGSTYGILDAETDEEGKLYYYLTAEEAFGRLVTASWGGSECRGFTQLNPDGTFQVALEPTSTDVFYEWHSLEDGWSFDDLGIDWYSDGQAAQDEHGHALTALRILTPLDGVHVSYAVRNGGVWGDSVMDGDIAGAMENPLQAMKASLSGDNASAYDICYRALVDGIGWTSWAKNGEECGDAGGNAAVKAVEVKIVPAGSEMPTDVETPADTEAPADEGIPSGQPAAAKLVSTGDNAVSAIAFGAFVALCALAIVVHARKKSA